MPVLTDQNGLAAAPALTANSIADSLRWTGSAGALNAIFNLSSTGNSYVLAANSAIAGSNAGRDGSVLLTASVPGSALATRLAPDRASQCRRVEQRSGPVQLFHQRQSRGANRNSEHSGPNLHGDPGRSVLHALRQCHHDRKRTAAPARGSARRHRQLVYRRCRSKHRQPHRTRRPIDAGRQRPEQPGWGCRRSLRQHLHRRHRQQCHRRVFRRRTILAYTDRAQ